MILYRDVYSHVEIFYDKKIVLLIRTLPILYSLKSDLSLQQAILSRYAAGSISYYLLYLVQYFVFSTL